MTTIDLKAAIQRLRTLSPKLNKATDQANQVVGMVEKFLNDECSIGMPAEVVLGREDLILQDEQVSDFTYLCYGRFSEAGGYRIGVMKKRQYERPDDRGSAGVQYETLESILWTSCPRELKLEAFLELPALLQEAAENAKRAVEKTDATTNAVNDIVAALKGTDD